jgi:hypothetical protein
LSKPLQLAIFCYLSAVQCATAHAQLYTAFIRSHSLSSAPAISFVPSLKFFNDSNRLDDFANYEVLFIPEGQDGTKSPNRFYSLGLVEPWGFNVLGDNQNELVVLSGSPHISVSNMLEEHDDLGPGHTATRLPVVALADTAKPNSDVVFIDLSWHRDQASSDIAIMNIDGATSHCSFRVPGFEPMFDDLKSLTLPPLSLLVIPDIIGQRSQGIDPSITLTISPVLRCSTHFYAFAINYSLLPQALTLEAVGPSPRLRLPGR